MEHLSCIFHPERGMRSNNKSKNILHYGVCAQIPAGAASFLQNAKRGWLAASDDDVNVEEVIWSHVEC